MDRVRERAGVRVTILTSQYANDRECKQIVYGFLAKAVYDEVLAEASYSAIPVSSGAGVPYSGHSIGSCSELMGRVCAKGFHSHPNPFGRLRAGPSPVNGEGPLDSHEV